VIADIVNFLTPSNEPIQIAFSCIIGVSVLSTIIWVKIKAREKFWEKKWQGEKADQLDSTLEVEHGSIHELSQAVATTAEKIAHIMPGMLLILGLLGTFLGLGLALDKASTILQNSGGASVGAMGGAMQDLTSMMQGLGTKFKTSTWGIIAFILLKVWESINGFEDRRLIWCIGKMKVELDKSRQQREQAKNEQAAFLQASMMGTSKVIVSALAVQTESMKGEWRRIAEQHQHSEQAHETQRQKNFEQINQGMIDVTKIISSLLQNGNEQHVTIQQSLAHLTEITQSSGQTQATLEQVNQGMLDLNKITTSILKNGNEHHVTAQQSLAHLTEITQSSGQTQATLEQVNQGMLDLNKITTSILKNGNEHHVTAQQSLAHLTAITKSSDQTQAAFEQFTKSSQENLAALQKAGTTMGDAALKVGESATGLKVVVDSLSTQMTDVLEGVKHGLNKTLGAMNQDFNNNLQKMAVQLEGATNQLSVVMDKVQTSLGSTIESMSKDFKQNLTGMSTNLQQATGDISTSIDKMSVSVNAAMEEVADKMKVTAEIQVESSEEFKQMSGGLTESVMAMTSMVEKVTKDIKLSLTAVSSSGQRMADLGVRYDNVSKMLEQIPDTLKALAAAPERPVPDLQPLQTSLNQLNDAAENIREALSARYAVEA